MTHVRTCTPEEQITMQPWPGLEGTVGWLEESLIVSASMSATVVRILEGALELLCSREADQRQQGEELVAALPESLRELSMAAAVAARVAIACREERTFLPRFWRISHRNIERLRRLGISLGADEMHVLEDDDNTIECEVYCLGI